MALVVFLQEDEYVPSVYRNLKIFCETVPRLLFLFSCRERNNNFIRELIKNANTYRPMNARLNTGFITLFNGAL